MARHSPILWKVSFSCFFWTVVSQLELAKGSGLVKIGNIDT